MLRRRIPRLRPEQVLSSRPMRNDALKTERIDGGGLRVFQVRRKDWWVRLLMLVLPIPRDRMIELDAAGEQVWDLCDGKHTLSDMIGLFQREHKLTRAEAEWSLRTYLRDLGKRGLVAFLVNKPKKNEGDNPDGRGNRRDSR